MEGAGEELEADLSSSLLSENLSYLPTVYSYQQVVPYKIGRSPGSVDRHQEKCPKHDVKKKQEGFHWG